MVSPAITKGARSALTSVSNSGAMRGASSTVERRVAGGVLLMAAPEVTPEAPDSYTLVVVRYTINSNNVVFKYFNVIVGFFKARVSYMFVSVSIRYA